VENGLAFESWRPVWAQYGGVVFDVARAAFPNKSDEELRAHTIEASALAMVDETTFDPLESLVTNVLAGASRESRSRAADVLQQHRVSSARVEAMVGITGRQPVAGFREPSESDAELFGVIGQRAQELQTSKLPTFLPPTNVRTVPEIEPPSALSRDRTACSPNKFVRVLLSLVVVLGSGAASAKLLWPHKRKPDPLLYSDRYASDWRVTEASSFTPARIRTPQTLVQTFKRLDTLQTVSLIVTDNRNWSAEPELPSGQAPPRGSPNRSAAQVSVVPGNTSSKRQQAVSFWKEGLYDVFLRSDSMSSVRAGTFLRGLVPTDDLLTRGYEPQEGFEETRRVIPASTSNDVSASITFTNKTQNPKIPLAVTINVLRDASREYLQLQELNGGIEKSGKPFGNRREFRNYRTFTAGLFGLFEEDKYTYFVSAFRQDSDFTRPNRQGQRNYFSGTFNSRELSESDQDDVFFLLAHVRAGDADEWRSLTGELQASMLQVPVQRTMRFGSQEVTLRRETDFVPGRAYMCTKNTCASLYNIEYLKQAADLLLDGHWWHFEELGVDDKIPVWTTSPKALRPFVAEDDAKDRTRWYAIDLGSDTRLARSRKDGEILGRPIA
jgi:hypothetical protein